MLSRFSFISIPLSLFAAAAVMAQPQQPSSKREELKVDNATGAVTFRAKTGQELPLYKESHALIIGVSYYSGGWGQLKTVEEDVKKLKEVLNEHGFRVVILSDPTLERLEKGINDFILKYGQEEENRLLVYYAGHGCVLKTPDNRKLGFVVPNDAPIPGPDNESQVEFKKRALSFDMFTVYAKQILAKHVLFIFDTCYSGIAIPNPYQAQSRGDKVDVVFHPTINSPVRQFITSATAEQKTPSESIFCKMFVNALAGADGPSYEVYFTGTELGVWLQRATGSNSVDAQLPQFYKIPDFSNGEFIFKAPERMGERSRCSPSLRFLTESSFFKSCADTYNSHGLSKGAECYRHFLRLFPDSCLAGEAQGRVRTSELLERQLNVDTNEILDSKSGKFKESGPQNRPKIP